ncbi:MAG: PDZ domain-containing protein, partial [Raoultibacter sp.]
GAFAGVGFAIPVNYAINIAQQIISGETPTHAQLGVSLSTVNEQIAQRYGLSVNEGAYISQVSAGSGAAEAGVQVGDIITKFNGQAITSASDLMLDVRSMSPGDKVTLELNRDGKTETVEVTLGSDGSTQNSSSQQQSGSLQELFGGGTSNNGNNA